MVRLEPFTQGDFKLLISWIDSAESLMQFAGPDFSFPLTGDQLAANLNDVKRKAYRVNAASGEMIGYGEIYLPDEERAVFCRILIGEERHRNRGLGFQVVQELLRISFSELRRQRAELFVFDWNKSAIRCYEKAGFHNVVGQSKKRETGGQVWTAIKMCVEERYWQPSKKT